MELHSTNNAAFFVVCERWFDAARGSMARKRKPLRRKRCRRRHQLAALRGLRQCSSWMPIDRVTHDIESDRKYADFVFRILFRQHVPVYDLVGHRHAGASGRFVYRRRSVSGRGFFYPGGRFRKRAHDLHA